jgi:D-methionine transport system ATP-binding protein
MSDRYAPEMLRLERVSLQATVGSDFILQDISLQIEPAEKIGIVGASGAGKTSLLRLLNGLTSPTQGKIFWQNTSTEQLQPIKLRRSVALAPQEPKLLGMNVFDALAYPLRLQQLSSSAIQTKIDTCTKMLLIPPEWFVRTELQLSLGQRQLVAIARALILQPEVILLDEPTSALDRGLANHLLTVLNELNQTQNLTIIMVNHQLELIKNFCDRLLFLSYGRLEEDVLATEANWQKIQQKFQLQKQADWFDF